MDTTVFIPVLCCDINNSEHPAVENSTVVECRLKGV